MSRHKILIDGVETTVVVCQEQGDCGHYGRVRVHALNSKGGHSSEHVVPEALLRGYSSNPYAYDSMRMKCRTGGHTYESGGGS